MSIRAKIKVDELLRLACIYAEDDRLDFVAAVRESDPDLAAETVEFLTQLRAYRLKRWGKTKREDIMATATEMRII